MQRRSSPPPMSPATNSAHNFYSGFNTPRPSNSPPPISHSQIPPSSARPSSVTQSSHGGRSAHIPSGYVNLQYYPKDPPGSSMRWAGPTPQSLGITSPPPLKSSFGNLNLGANATTMTEEEYRIYIQQQHALNSSPPPPPMNPTNYAPKSSGPSHYQRTTSPPLGSNLPYMNSGYNSQRPLSRQVNNKLRRSYTDDATRSDLSTRSPILGVRAAAAARAREERDSEPMHDESFWGLLFENHDGQQVGTELLGYFLRGVAEYIIDEFEPKNSLVITPPKMLAFYTKFRSPGEPLEWDIFFFGRPVKALSEVYQVLNCHHHLVPPKDSANSAPTVPGLTPRGFERWMTVQILANPNRESKRLIDVLKQCPIQNPNERDPVLRRFPKTLTREAFPKYADGEIKGLWDLLIPEAELPRSPRPQPTRAATTPVLASSPSRDREEELEARTREFEALEQERARFRAEELSRPYSMLDDELTGARLDRASQVQNHDYNYEAMQSPRLVNNGIERERNPYSKPIVGMKEDPAHHDSDEEYYLPPNKAQPQVQPSNRQRAASGSTPRVQYLPSPSHSPPVQKHYELDEDEEDLQQIIQAKRAEIEAIEARLQLQAHRGSQHTASPQILHPLDQEEEEARQNLRRAEEDWKREEEERKKWVDVGRQRYERDNNPDDYTTRTPISQYSWRDTYQAAAPLGPGGKRANGSGGRMSQGGEWEEFKYDESPVSNRPRMSSITQRDNVYGAAASKTIHIDDCGCGGYEHPSCGVVRL